MKNLSFLQIVLIVALIILIYVNKNKIIESTRALVAPDTTPGGTNGATTSGNSNTPGLDYNVRLETGSKSAEVSQLQTWINQAGYLPPLVIDGNFGIKTANAVKYYNNGAPSITLAEAQAIIFSKLTNGLF